METLQRTANRGSISTGYDIDNSLKMESDNSESMTRTPSSSGNRKTWTVSFWFKRTELGAAVRLFEAWDGSIGTSALFTDTDFFILDLNTASNYFTSTQVFRDTSAWYHFVVRVDTTSATDSERARVYVNGSELVGSWTGGYIGQNTDLTWNQNVVHYLGVFHTTSNFANGYYAEVINVDGTSLAPTAFGEFDEDSGIWKPKAYTGSYGTNGFYLDFENSGSLGADSSGNGHTWTLNNITSADQATDTPTNNFCTLNPLVFQNENGVYSFITEGATKATATQFDVFYTYAPTFGVTSGKWYAEFEYEGSQADNLVGILDIDAVVPFNSYLGKAGAWSVGLYQANGKLYVTSDSGTTSTANWGASAADGDIISVAVDMDNHFVYFAKNGTWQNSGVPTSGATGTGGVAFDSNKTVGIGCSSYDQGGDEGQIFTNYGGFTAGTISSGASDSSGYGTFEYAPPTGYYALCTKNLAEFG